MEVVKVVVACSAGGIIGVNGKIPWNKPVDMKRFRELTVGGSIVMGRKTFESIGKPLPKRNNYVVSRDRKYSAGPGTISFCCLDAALEHAQTLRKPIFIIGGGEIYNQAIRDGLVDYVDVTIINDYDGPVNESEHNQITKFDVTFPESVYSCFKYELESSTVNESDYTLLHNLYKKVLIK